MFTSVLGFTITELREARDRVAEHYRKSKNQYAGGIYTYSDPVTFLSYAEIMDGIREYYDLRLQLRRKNRIGKIYRHLKVSFKYAKELKNGQVQTGYMSVYLENTYSMWSYTAHATEITGFNMSVSDDIKQNVENLFIDVWQAWNDLVKDQPRPWDTYIPEADEFTNVIGQYEPSTSDQKIDVGYDYITYYCGDKVKKWAYKTKLDYTSTEPCLNRLDSLIPFDWEEERLVKNGRVKPQIFEWYDDGYTLCRLVITCED